VQALHLLMYVSAGTAVLAIFLSSATSIANYVALGVRLDLPLLVLLHVGTLVGPGLARSCRAACASAG
jgi:uncharacterized membrane protein YfcA